MAEPTQVKLTQEQLVRVKDNIGNTVCTISLDKEGCLLVYPHCGNITIIDNPLTVRIPPKRA